MTVVDRTSSEFKALVELYDRAPLLELGQLADAERWRRHPEPVVTYIIDRNINYTNVCVADCQFCAFYRRPKHAEGYVLSFEEIGRKIDECKAVGGVQILMQGWHNPLHPVRVVPRSDALHQAQPSDSHSRLLALGSGVLQRAVRTLRARRPYASFVARVSTASRAAAARFWWTRSGSGSPARKSQTEEWLGVQEEAHRQV
jgi:cyclic dehypoxanthinyl futalosine synthase